MRSKFLVMALALVLGSGAARGDVLMADLAPQLATESARALHAAIQRERIDTRRVREQETLITEAEYDLARAHVDREISLENRDKAKWSGDVAALRTWAPRYEHSLRDASDAFGRVLRHRLGRDAARADLARSAAAVRHADALVQRDARG